MNKNKRNFRDIILYELKFCFRHSPILMIVETSACLLHGISFVIVTYMTQFFFDEVTKAMKGNISIRAVYTAALLLGISVILNQLINGVENFSLEVLTNKLLGYSKVQLYSKSSRLNAEFFESPDMQNFLNKAAEGAEYITIPLFPIIGVTTFYVSYFVGMGIYVLKLHPVLLALLVFVFIPSIASQNLKISLYAKLTNEAAPYRRKAQHYEECICGKKYMKETRTLSAGKYFRNMYKDSLSILSKKNNEANSKAIVIEMKARSLTLIGYFFIVVFLVVGLLNNIITAGAFAAVFMSVDKLFSMMEEAVILVGDATQNFALVKNYLDFLDYPENMNEDMEVSIKKSVKMKSVCYKYPGTDQYALSNIGITIKAGETVAIVGENGAGKTTFVRLLCGLFSPTSGSVFYDDKDIKKVSREILYRNISAVFQNFQKYQMTLKENLIIGNLNNKESKLNDYTIQNVARELGLEISNCKFADGLYTILSREFGGVELSGGQWQRIAIGRGLLKSGDLIILDEPTASIDPFEENQLYNTFERVSRNRTTVIVTHRLGVARIADKIIVLKNGEIVEIGTHVELMSANGKYKEMFEAQAKWYTANKETSYEKSSIN